MSKSPLVAAIEKKDNVTTTTNGMKAFKKNLDTHVELFSSLGAMRGRDPLPKFAEAYKNDKEKALRIALWARDVRGGAGERQLYRDILHHIAVADYKQALELIGKTVELGRWDDLLSLHDTAVWPEVVEFIRQGLDDGNGLCAKWLPRKGDVAYKLRKSLGWTPKFYRKTIVGLTSVVEQLMCSKNWNAIEYSKIPSVASARYQKAFGRNDHTRYEDYILSLEKGETTINASAVYPYDVVHSVRYGNSRVADQQWKALPDYIDNDLSFLPVVDVSGSMGCPAGGYGSKSNVTCMDVAISLGLYIAERNKSVFKDSFITFSATPALQQVSGNLSTRVNQMQRAQWDMNTNLMATFDLILDSAVKGGVKQEDMPNTIIIFSDMQFDSCVSGKTAVGAMKEKYKKAGYVVPNVVFWNINDSGNKPVATNKEGVSLVSGFSPSLMRSILSAKSFTPEDIMLETIMSTRYDVKVV